MDRTAGCNVFTSITHSNHIAFSIPSPVSAQRRKIASWAYEFAARVVLSLTPPGVFDRWWC